MSATVDAPHKDLTYQIIGSAMDVHNSLGPGLKEEVYENALYLVLQQRGLGVEKQKAIEVKMGDDPVGLLIADLLVDESVVVEVKALHNLLTNDEVAQVISYLTALNLDVGLAINFGRRSLDFRRIFPPKRVLAHRDRVARQVVKPKTVNG